MDRPYLTERIEKLILTGIIVIIIVRPIIFWLMPVFDIKVAAHLLLQESWAHSIIEFLILTTALFYILRVALAKEAAIRNSPADASLLGFLFICALSLIYTVDRDASLRSLLLLFSYITFFYLVVHNLDSSEVVKFCGLLIGLAAVLSLYGLYEYFFLYRFIGEHMDISFIDAVGREMISLRRVSSVFGWPNRLAGFLGMSIPVSIGIFLYEKRLKVRIILALSTMAMFLGMLFTFSIGGWLALIGSLIFMAVLCFWFIGRGLREFISRRKFFISAISLFLIIVLAGAGWIMAEKRATPVTQGAIKCRVAYLKGAIGIIKDNLVSGTGLGTFKVVYPQYMPAQKGYGAWHAHNSYLEIWSETGLLGIALFLIFIWQIMTAGSRLLTDTTNPRHKFVIIGLISGITAFLLHNIMEFTFYCPEVSLFWWLLIGLLLVYAKEEGGLFRFNSLSKRLVLGGFSILLFYALFILANNFAGDIYFFRATRLVGQEDFEKGIQACRQALRFNPRDSRYHYCLGDAYCFLSMKQHSQRFLDKAEQEYKEAIRLNPNFAEAHNKLANIYEQTNRRPKAIEEYQKTIKLNPAYSNAHYNLGVVYDRQGKLKEAKEEFKKAIQIDPDFFKERP